VKPSLLKTVKQLLGEGSEANISYSDIVQRGISHTPEDVKRQVINEVKPSPTPMFFSHG